MAEFVVPLRKTVWLGKRWQPGPRFGRKKSQLTQAVKTPKMEALCDPSRDRTTTTFLGVRLWESGGL